MRTLIQCFETQAAGATRWAGLVVVGVILAGGIGCNVDRGNSYRNEFGQIAGLRNHRLAGVAGVQSAEPLVASPSDLAAFRGRHHAGAVPAIQESSLLREPGWHPLRRY